MSLLLILILTTAGIAGTTESIRFAEARQILVEFASQLPAALQHRSLAELEERWPGWVDEEDSRLRARIRQGDEDSVVNLWLFGTSFTAAPPLRTGPGFRLPDSDSALLNRRLEDFLQAIMATTPGPRLEFARSALEEAGIDLSGTDSPSLVREHLLAARRRVLEENRLTDERLLAARQARGVTGEVDAQATIFAERGLSSDTSLLSSFAIYEGLSALASSGVLAPDSVRRVAVIGPGLDVINKADGYDFYPEQTIQPFAVIDALRRLQLAARGGLRITTFDVSPRVNGHLRGAVARAGNGLGYLVHLPLGARDQWSPALLAYWKSWGDTIGEPATPVDPPNALGDLQIRAVQVTSDVVAMLNPVDLNIVLERATLPDSERFDLVVATNVFVYYSPFEQALAGTNVAAMLRPGGSLLSNTPLGVRPPMSDTGGYARIDYSDRQFDRLFWYRREP